MKIVKADKIGFLLAVKILKSNGVIVYPTDTAYGLGGKFNSARVIKKILKIKNRRNEKFTIVAASLGQVNKFFKLNKLEIKLAKKYWPGPLSIAISDKFAVRVPNNLLCRKLCLVAKTPLIATSANISGQDTPYDIKEVSRQFANKKNYPDLILNGGNLRRIRPSTLVLVKNGKLEILRPGPIKPVV